MARRERYKNSKLARIVGSWLQSTTRFPWSLLLLVYRPISSGISLILHNARHILFVRFLCCMAVLLQCSRIFFALRAFPTLNQSLWSIYPNPFFDYNSAIEEVEELLLVDGSTTGKTIPLRPLIQPARKLDLIILFDTSGDGENGWVNGTNIIGKLNSH